MRLLEMSYIFKPYLNVMVLFKSLAVYELKINIYIETFRSLVLDPES